MAEGKDLTIPSSNVSVVASGPVSVDKTTTGLDNYECEYCKDVCTNWAELKTHHASMHSHLPAPVQVTDKDICTKESGIKKYKCPECAQTNDSYAAIRDHLRGHVKPYKCAYCRISFNYPFIVKSHQMKEHPGMEINYEALEDMNKVMSEMRNNILEYDETTQMHVQMQRTATIKNRKKRKRNQNNDNETQATSSPSKIAALDSSTEEEATEKALPLATPNKRQTRSLLQKAQKTRPTARKSTAAPPPPTRKMSTSTPAKTKPHAKSKTEPASDSGSEDVEIEFLGGTVLMTSEQYGQMKRTDRREDDAEDI